MAGFAKLNYRCCCNRALTEKVQQPLDTSGRYAVPHSICRGASTHPGLPEDESMVTQTIAQLQDIYKGYQVQQPFNGEDIKREMESITLPFMLMTFIVAFMSMFIIFSSFRVITMERLPVIGTFRSIGATRKTTDNIMLVESLLYGIVGSGLGLGLGIIILNIMSETLKDPWIKDMETRAVYTPSQMGLSFAFGVLCALRARRFPF